MDQSSISGAQFALVIRCTRFQVFRAYSTSPIPPNRVTLACQLSPSSWAVVVTMCLDGAARPDPVLLWTRVHIE